MDKFKSCVFCEHFVLDEGTIWSTLTVEDPESHCTLGVFYDGIKDGVDKGIARASTCDHYTVAQKIKDEISGIR